LRATQSGHNCFNPGEPKPLTLHAAEALAELERIVTKALTKDREESYQIKDMAIDLRRLSGRRLETFKLATP